ncbi:hypothetical protein HAZT_HAZT009394 [Hyalella azteca]|uniref:Ig-like domain-containing protein n=1 Tax=Hyalella azteca TaxID=294128 RepID=A0A6A0H1G3_HYAAZ|nr:hypothetical protein HAZT_HAZT009394 [Hyalella azteca]
MAWAGGRIVSGGNIAKLPPPSRGRIPIDGKYKTETSKKYYNNPKGARITKASHFNFQYVLGHKIVFLCVARDLLFPQLHEWTRGQKLKSKMEIDPASQADAGIYECHANNMYAMDSRAFRTTYLAEFN